MTRYGVEVGGKLATGWFDSRQFAEYEAATLRHQGHKLVRVVMRKGNTAGGHQQMSLLLQLPLILVHSRTGFLSALFAAARAYSQRCALRLRGVFLRTSARYLSAVSDGLRSHNASVPAVAAKGPYHMTVAAASGRGDFKFSKVLPHQVDSFHGAIITHTEALGGMQCTV